MPQHTHTPLTRRLSSALGDADLELASTGDRIQIAGPAAAIDRLLDRIQPIRRPAGCTGQLSLFDPAPYTAIRQLPTPSDPQLSLISSTDRGAA